MVYREAAIHDDRNAGRFQLARHRVMPDPLLHPDQPGTHFQECVQQSRDVLRAAEDVHDIDRAAGRRSGPKIGVYLLAQGDAGNGMHRDDAIPSPLEIGSDTVTGPLRLSTQANDGDRPSAPNQLSELRQIRRHPASLRRGAADER